MMRSEDLCSDNAYLGAETLTLRSLTGQLKIRLIRGTGQLYLHGTFVC